MIYQNLVGLDAIKTFYNLDEMLEKRCSIFQYFNSHECKSCNVMCAGQWVAGARM